MSYVNAHVFTNPTKKETDYYWIRIIDDKTYGISGFVYVTNGVNAYDVLPKDVVFKSKTQCTLTATVLFGKSEKPAVLTVTVSNTSNKLLAGYTVASSIDPTIIYDSSPITEALPGGYIKLDSTK